MTYSAPFIDSAGLHLSTYQDYEDYFVQQAQAIFGPDIYLANDSQDFQMLAAIAKAAFDTCQLDSLTYNNRSPATAIGAGLDIIVALNGLRRKSTTPSIAPVTLAGTAFTVISNGIAGDINGNSWALPASVTLDAGGHALVAATCQTDGNITALAGQITNIVTPTSGWTSVTNVNAATPGQPVETDSLLRARQALSVANPAQGLTTALYGAILAVPGIISAQIYENDTPVPQTVINGVTNPGGFPANSLTLVVDGGDDAAIAQAYAVRKPPGCFANGDQIQLVVDRYSMPTTIRYFRPTDTPVDVVLNVKALSGYSLATAAAAKQAMSDYINGGVAGQNVVLSSVEQAAMSVFPNLRTPLFSVNTITACLHGGTPIAADVPMNFNLKASLSVANITIISS